MTYLAVFHFKKEPVVLPFANEGVDTVTGTTSFDSANELTLIIPFHETFSFAPVNWI